MPNSIERARRAIAEALRTHPATLSLRGDGLTELPDELWSLVDLEWLDLGDNQLTQLDPRIASFKALRYLDISGNRLVDVDILAQLPNLAELRVAGNPLHELPPRLATLRPTIDQPDRHLIFDAFRTDQGFGFSDGKPDFGLHSRSTGGGDEMLGGQPSTPGVLRHETRFKRAKPPARSFEMPDFEMPDFEIPTAGAEPPELPPELPAAPPPPASAQPATPSLPAADRSAEPAPPPDAEAVDAAVFCPPTVARAGSFLVQCFLYPPESSAAVDAQAREADDAATRRGSYSLPLDIPRGARIDLHLELPGLTVPEPDAFVTWRGRIAPVQFDVTVPADTPGANAIGRIRFAVDGVPAGTLRFQVGLAPAGTPAEDADAREVRARRYRRAFISYSSKDRVEVLKRVQGIRQTGITVFQDILDLEPGMRWEKALYREIDNCDVLYLFWSTSAAQSEWVKKEIDYALARKAGVDDNPPDIQPMPIEGPPIVPPPEALKALHFNDALLAQIAVASLPKT